MRRTISDMVTQHLIGIVIEVLIEELQGKYVDDPTAPERIGFVLRDGTIVELKNMCHDPANGFDFSGEDLLRYEDEALASWHTHTGKDCNLSTEDLNSFLNWPGLTHYIVGSDGVAAYAVEKGNVLRAATYPSSRRAEEHPPGAH